MNYTLPLWLTYIILHLNFSSCHNDNELLKFGSYSSAYNICRLVKWIKLLGELG